MNFRGKSRNSILIGSPGMDAADIPCPSLLTADAAAEQAAVPRESAAFPWPVAHQDGTTREQLILLAQKLFFTSTSNRMILLTGCGSGVGCTWITVQLAGILAAHRKGSVCIVDASLRQPSVHKVFDMNPSPGLSDLVLNSARAETIARRLTGVDAAIFTAGTPTSDPAALLGSEKMKARLLEFRSRFDYILVDCASANEYPDASMLAPLCDGVLLVVAAGVTRKQVAVFCKQQIESTAGKVLGAVLNRREFPIPTAVYSKLA